MQMIWTEEESLLASEESKMMICVMGNPNGIREMEIVRFLKGRGTTGGQRGGGKGEYCGARADSGSIKQEADDWWKQFREFRTGYWWI